MSSSDDEFAETKWLRDCQRHNKISLVDEVCERCGDTASYPLPEGVVYDYYTLQDHSYHTLCALCAHVVVEIGEFPGMVHE